MKTLKELKKDIQFNHELGGLIEVLKGIASSEFRHLQAKREYNLRFIRCLDSIFTGVNLIKSNHPFIKAPSSSPGQVKNESLESSGIVMVTSDEGFLGELNNQVINTGLSRRKLGDELIILGERGAHFLEEMKESFFYFPGIPEEIKYEMAQNLRNYVVQRYLKKKFQKALIIYPKFISFSVQKVEVEQLLPYVPATHLATEEDRRFPGGGTLSALDFSRHLEIIVEPSANRIIDYLIRIWLAQKMYDIFWDSKLSELSSRVIHLEGSSHTITEMGKKLQFSYFRTIHQISDKNIREIFASRLKEAA